MRRHFLRSFVIALITLLLGSGVDSLTSIETVLGLDTLFQIRGTRTPPGEIVVVAMDEASESRLGVGQDLTRWRGLHAKVIKELQRQGAALIVFDLQFVAPNPDQDPTLSTTMRAAANVLVTDCVQKFRRGVEDFYGREECSERNKEPIVSKTGEQNGELSERLIAMRRISPTVSIADSVLDHAPFYLANDAEISTIHEAWTFYDVLAESPSLPVVTWFYFLQRTSALPNYPTPNTSYSVWLTERRRACPAIDSTGSPNSLEKSALEKRIDDVICRGDSRYLDFYGPPHTLRMESYSDVYDGKVSDLQGKVVFIGKANRKFSPGKIDYFQTPYTDSYSGKMSGVEIMATQFANLIEGRFVEAPLPPSVISSIFGFAVSYLLIRFTGLPGMAISLLFGGIYAGLSAWCFSRNGLWLPVAVPLLIQLPAVWLISLGWSRRDLINERKRIMAFVRRVFPQWITVLPTSPGQWHAENASRQLTSNRDVAGLCLATDIEGYTSIASHHTPHQMWELLNDYYQVLGHPVSSHDGLIADVAGDAMMAVWIDLPVETQRLAACLAALEMKLAIERFNKTSNLGPISTRIGLHEGEMTLGRLDAGEASHFRAIGDTVNTASRIQGVNKFLGTHILASKTIASKLTNIYYRPVGTFGLVGREKPVELIEIVGIETEITTEKTALYQKFAHGLNAFQRGQWREAATIFQKLLDRHQYDGPTRFYLDLALAYKDDPHLVWEGVVTLAEK